MSSPDIIKKLEKIYFKSGYLDKHGKDVWLSLIICLLFALFIYYQHFTNVLEVVRANWTVERANPAYMAFAGFINKPKNQSNSEFTSENFMGVVRSILKSVSLAALKPFQSVLAILNKIVQDLIDQFDMLRGLIDRLRDRLMAIFAAIYAVGVNLSLEFLSFIIKVRDTMGKTNGVLATALYVLFGAFMTMRSMFLSIVQFLTLILIAIAVIILLYIAIATGLFPILFVGPALALPSILVGMATLVIFILIMVLVILFNIFMMRVLNISTPQLPKVPSCFAGDTLIALVSGEHKKIKDIKIGDQLAEGGEVTAVMQFTAEGQNVYRLNGVCVTGEHRVFHPILQTWIKVKEHPESRFLPAFSEPFVYCLNTATKEFSINATRFSDWDDIDAKVMEDLRTNCPYLPPAFTVADIQPCLVSGLHPETPITLKDGSVKPIHAVTINEVLWENTKVVGVIHVAAGDNIQLYNHSAGGSSSICGSQNIHIAPLGTIQKNAEDIASQPLLYHLLTDTSFFVANGIKVHDYNYGIDAYLS